MVHFCIMSGHEGRLGSENKVYLTLMGGCELIRPTFARQIVARRKQEGRAGTELPRQTFLTLMGATEIKAPTLAEELIDLQELLNSGELHIDALERNTADVERLDVSISSFTLMGGFSECELPSEDEEVDSLALQRHLGHIPESAGQILQYGIGRRGAERLATLRRALAATA